MMGIIVGTGILRTIIVFMAACCLAFPAETTAAVSADEAYAIGTEAYIYFYPLVTMYDTEGFQIANPLNRFAIGDRDALIYNSDGSLEIYIQPESPGKEKEANWLPAPSSGSLGVTMRLYAPKET